MGGTDTERAKEAQATNEHPKTGPGVGVGTGTQRPEAGTRRQQVVGADRVALPGDTDEEDARSGDEYHTSGSGARTSSTAGEHAVNRDSGSPEPASTSKKPGKSARKSSRRKSGQAVESPPKKSPDNQREDREDRRGQDRDRGHAQGRDHKQGRDERDRQQKELSKNPARRDDRASARSARSQFDRDGGAEPKPRQASVRTGVEPLPQRMSQFGTRSPALSKTSQRIRPDDPILNLSRTESTFVNACFEIWMKTPARRVSPEPVIDKFALNMELIAKRGALHDQLTKDEPIAYEWFVEWCGAPVDYQQMCYAVSLEPLGMAEQVAVLQTALFDAGYSFKNIVPLIVRADSPFDLWAADHITREALEIRGLLEECVIHMESLQRTSKKAVAPLVSMDPAPLTHAIDPNALRMPASIMSSSEWTSRPGVSDTTGSGDLYPARGRRHDSAEDDGITGAGFFQSRGLSWKSDDGYDEPVRVPSPYHPKPAAFDEPMTETPARPTAHVYRASAGQTPRRSVMPAFGSSSPAYQPRFGAPSQLGASAPPARYSAPEPVNVSAARLSAPAPVHVHAPRFNVPMPAAAPESHFSVPAPASVPAPQQPVIVYPRPFVPAGYLEPLTGEEPLEERRQWMADYKAMARTAMWSEEEMCQNIYRYVRKPALTFIRQLGRRARSWGSLEADIAETLLASTESPVQRYCSLAQDKTESARHFLWRLNSAADRARIDVRTPEGLERHVTQFARALRDQDVKQKMSSVVVRSLKELDKMLALYEQRTGSGRPDIRSSDRPSSRDRDREYERDRRDRERSSSRPRQASTYWAYQDDYGGNEFVRSASDFEDEPDNERTVRFRDEDDYYDAPDDEEARAFRVAGQSAPAYGRPSNGPSRWPSNGQSAGPKFRAPTPPAPAQSAQQAPRQPNGNAGYTAAPVAAATDRTQGMCFNCGEHGHWAAQCPNRQPVCSLCRGAHPPEFCWKKCPACSQVHAKPEECAVVRAIEELKVWYKSPANANGSPALPPSVLQHIDKPLN